MRGLVRNKSKFYYATYIGETEILDKYGNRTGEYQISYSEPKVYFANISPAQGRIEDRQFGTSENYDKVIVLDDRNVSIDEHSILWVDSLPNLNEDGTTDTPHDYCVKQVARSINSVSIAIKKVNVNG